MGWCRRSVKIGRPHTPGAPGRYQGLRHFLPYGLPITSRHLPVLLGFSIRHFATISTASCAGATPSTTRCTEVVSSEAPGNSLPRALDEEVAELRRQLVERDSRIADLEKKTTPQHRQRAFKLPEIPEEDRTPLVVTLLEVIQLQREQIQGLRDEIARLKGEKPKPKIKPSRLEDARHPKGKTARRDWAKRHKTSELVIHETVVIRPADLPEESRFRGYQDYTVQDIVLKPFNTRYRLERWRTPDGKEIVGQLPQEVIPGHFGPTLVSFILYQHYHALVTQPLLLEQVREFGVDISKGQLSRILTEGKERFHSEKDEILRVGLMVSGHINVDDTGARHEGKNGYCTHIGNELFAWFRSTSSKSRINFLELLRAGRTDYVLCDIALAYMKVQKLPKCQLKVLAKQQDRLFENKEQWETALKSMGITCGRHVRIATEGALLGSVLQGDIHPELVIVSDDAGQFNVLLHALCWVHAERTIVKLVGFSEAQREAIEAVRTQIWYLYKDLKAYKEAPTAEKKEKLGQRFNEIFSQKTCFQSLNLALKRLLDNKSELLLVLERPDVPLHNNLSESDIREYVKKRKISGSTRSDLGRMCRDTFASLKKTCRKLGVSFWSYLKDRVSGSHTMSSLAELIR